MNPSNYKKKLLLALLLLVAGLAGAMMPQRAVAQSNNPYIKLSPSEIVMDAAASEATITVTSNWGWNADVAYGGWVSVLGNKTVYGSGTEAKQNCRIRVSMNTGTKERMAYVYFRGLQDTTVKNTLTIRQKGRPAPFIKLSKNEIEMYTDGGQETITVTSNCGWSSRLYYNGSDGEWLKQGDVTRIADRVTTTEEKMLVIIQPNHGKDRTGYITITSRNDPTVKVQLIVRQKGKQSEAFVKLSRYLIRNDALGGEVTIDVTSNSGWEAKVVPYNYTIPGTYLSLDSFPKETLDKASSLEYDKWLHISPGHIQSPGFGTESTKQFSFTLAPYTHIGDKFRTAYIVFKDLGSPTVRAILSVKQDMTPKNYIKLSKEQIEMEAAGGEASVDVTSNCPWNSKSDYNPPVPYYESRWLDVTIPGSVYQVLYERVKTASDKMRMRILPNLSTTERTVKIVFQNPKDPTVRAQLIVRQKRGSVPDINLSKRKIEMDALGGEETFTVSSNWGWSATVASHSWVSLPGVDYKNFYGNGSWIKQDCRIKISPNLHSEPRHLIIYFRDPLTQNVRTYLHVLQKGRTYTYFPKPIKRVTFEKRGMVVDGGLTDLVIVKAEIAPIDATRRELVWFSTDTTVAVIDKKEIVRTRNMEATVNNEVKVRARKVGETLIIATTMDGSCLADTCRLEVRSLPTANIEPSAPSAMRIYTSAGRLYLSLPTSAAIHIYTVSGTLLRTFTAPAGESSVALPQGVYVVKAGAKTEKVVVQ